MVAVSDRASVSVNWAISASCAISANDIPAASTVPATNPSSALAMKDGAVFSAIKVLSSFDDSERYPTGKGEK